MKQLATAGFALLLPAVMWMTAVPASANPHGAAKLLLHVKSTTKSPNTVCTTWAPRNVACPDFDTSALLEVATYAYLIVARADADIGVAGLSCGIQYGHNLLVMSWTRCSDLEFPSGQWPLSGGGNRITWANQTNCQRSLVPGSEDQGVHAIAGFFTLYAYGPDELSVTRNFNPPIPELVLADCNAMSYDVSPEATGSVRFSSSGIQYGRNPCLDDTTLPPPPLPPKVLLHIGSVVPQSTACAAKPSTVSSVVTSAPAREDGSAGYFVYLLGTPPTPGGLTAVQVGIDYQLAGVGDGIWVSSWHSCGMQEFPTPGWPGQGSGNTIMWTTDACQRAPLVGAGYFYLTAYSSAIMAVAGHPMTGVVKVADCSGAGVEPDQEVTMDRVGWVSFGGAASGQDHNGCNPALESCERPVPVRATTWGAIKAKYEAN